MNRFTGAQTEIGRSENVYLFVYKYQLFVYILETPCWIEVQLHRALQLADELLHSIPIEHHRRMNSHMND